MKKGKGGDGGEGSEGEGGGVSSVESSPRSSPRGGSNESVNKKILHVELAYDDEKEGGKTDPNLILKAVQESSSISSQEAIMDQAIRRPYIPGAFTVCSMGNEDKKKKIKKKQMVGINLGLFVVPAYMMESQGPKVPQLRLNASLLDLVFDNTRESNPEPDADANADPELVVPLAGGDHCAKMVSKMAFTGV